MKKIIFSTAVLATIFAAGSAQAGDNRVPMICLFEAAGYFGK